LYIQNKNTLQITNFFSKKKKRLLVIMPEGPEVLQLSNDLKTRILNRYLIGAFEDGNSRYAKEGGIPGIKLLINSVYFVANVFTKGKHIFVQLNDYFNSNYIVYLEIRLGDAGRLAIEKTKHCNISLMFCNNVAAIVNNSNNNSNNSNNYITSNNINIPHVNNTNYNNYNNTNYNYNSRYYSRDNTTSHSATSTSEEDFIVMRSASFCHSNPTSRSNSFADNSPSNSAPNSPSQSGTNSPTELSLQSNNSSYCELSYGSITNSHSDSNWCVNNHSDDLFTINTNTTYSQYYNTTDNFHPITATQEFYIYLDDHRHHGAVEFKTEKELNEKLKKIGPDMLSDNVPYSLYEQIFIKTAKRNPNWQICQFLMNQSKLSGVGNYLKADILYMCRISPLRSLKDITNMEIQMLYFYTVSLIKEAFNAGGLTIRNFYTIDGEVGLYKKRIYGRKTDDYGYSVIRTETADTRTSHWVPNVQK